MNIGLRSGLVALALTLSIGSAQAALNQNQVQELEKLVVAGNVQALIQWLNQNLVDVDLNSPLGLAIGNFMQRANQPGVTIDPEIISAVRDSAEQY